MNKLLSFVIKGHGVAVSTIQNADGTTTVNVFAASDAESQDDLPTKQLTSIEADALAVMPYLGQALHPDGAIKHGWGAKLIAVLYGKKKASAGRYLDRAKSAVEQAQKMKPLQM